MSLEFDDKIWVNEARKIEGVCRDVGAAIAQHLNVVIVAHFENMRSILSRELSAREIDYSTHPPGHPSELCSTEPKVWLMLASHLRAGAANSTSKNKSLLRVLVVEHHPLPARDDALFASLEGLPCPAQTTFHSALTDALLARFVGDGVKQLLDSLGHSEDEQLSSPLISAAIRRAQEKIGKLARGDMPTQSAEDWLRYNVPRQS